MNSQSSRGNDGPSLWPTVPRQNVTSSWMHRTRQPAVLAAPQAAKLAGRQRWHPPHLQLSLSRVGIWQPQSQLSAQLTDEREMRLYTDSLLSALKLQKSLRLIFKHHMLEIFTVFSEFKEFRSSLVGLVLLFVFLFCFHVTPEHFLQLADKFRKRPCWPGPAYPLHCWITGLPMLDDHPLPPHLWGKANQPNGSRWKAPDRSAQTASLDWGGIEQEQSGLFPPLQSVFGLALVGHPSLVF